MKTCSSKLVQLSTEMALIKPINFIALIIKTLFYLGISPNKSPSLFYRIYGSVVFVIYFAIYDILLIGEVLSSQNFNEMVYSGACAIGKTFFHS